MDNEALHASNFFQTFQNITKNPEVTKKITQSEKIARLAHSDDWQAMEEAISLRIKFLKDQSYIKSGDTAESVGLRVLAAQVAIEYLEDIKNLPQLLAKGYE